MYLYTGKVFNKCPWHLLFLHHKYILFCSHCYSRSDSILTMQVSYLKDKPVRAIGASHGAASKVLRCAIAGATCPHGLVSWNPSDLPCACDSMLCKRVSDPFSLLSKNLSVGLASRQPPRSGPCFEPRNRWGDLSASDSVYGCAQSAVCVTGTLTLRVLLCSFLEGSEITCITWHNTM